MARTFCAARLTTQEIVRTIQTTKHFGTLTKCLFLLHRCILVSPDRFMAVEQVLANMDLMLSSEALGMMAENTRGGESLRTDRRQLHILVNFSDRFMVEDVSIVNAGSGLALKDLMKEYRLAEENIYKHIRKYNSTAEKEREIWIFCRSERVLDLLGSTLCFLETKQKCRNILINSELISLWSWWSPLVLEEVKRTTPQNMLDCSKLRIGAGYGPNWTHPIFTLAFLVVRSSAKSTTRWLFSDDLKPTSLRIWPNFALVHTDDMMISWWSVTVKASLEVITSVERKKFSVGEARFSGIEVLFSLVVGAASDQNISMAVFLCVCVC